MRVVFPQFTLARAALRATLLPTQASSALLCQKLEKGREKDPALAKPAGMGHPKALFGIKARPAACGKWRVAIGAQCTVAS